MISMISLILMISMISLILMTSLRGVGFGSPFKAL